MVHKVYLLNDLAPKNLHVDEIADYLRSYGFKVEEIGDFLECFDVDKVDFAEGLAKLKIKDATRSGVLNPNPTSEDIEDELKILNNNKSLKLKMDFTDIYEGFEFSNLFKNYLKDGLNIAFSSRMLLSWSNGYHGRTIIINPPITIISTTGIVEAPIRPYYAELMHYQMVLKTGILFPLQGSIEDFERELKRKNLGKFIEYDDERLTEVVKGFVMQALVYFLTGDAFCEDHNCRLFDAHTQKDLIRSQLITKKFCYKHEAILNSIKNEDPSKPIRGLKVSNVKVNFFGLLSKATGEKETEIMASTLKEALNKLVAKYNEPLKKIIFDKTGKLRGIINFYMNGKNLSSLNILETKLKQGDKISIIPAYSGG